MFFCFQLWQQDHRENAHVASNTHSIRNQKYTHQKKVNNFLNNLHGNEKVHGKKILLWAYRKCYVKKTTLGYTLNHYLPSDDQVTACTPSLEQDRPMIDCWSLTQHLEQDSTSPNVSSIKNNNETRNSLRSTHYMPDMVENTFYASAQLTLSPAHERAWPSSVYRGQCVQQRGEITLLHFLSTVIRSGTKSPTQVSLHGLCF